MKVIWMSIHLFFNIITAFVSAEFIVISEFLDAVKYKILTVPSATLRLHILELIISRKYMSKEMFLPNLETGGIVITWCKVRRIWWMTHFFKSDSKCEETSLWTEIFI